MTFFSINQEKSVHQVLLLFLILLNPSQKAMNNQYSPAFLSHPTRQNKKTEAPKTPVQSSPITRYYNRGQTTDSTGHVLFVALTWVVVVMRRPRPRR